MTSTSIREVRQSPSGPSFDTLNIAAGSRWVVGYSNDFEIQNNTATSIPVDDFQTNDDSLIDHDAQAIRLPTAPEGTRANYWMIYLKARFPTNATGYRALTLEELTIPFSTVAYSANAVNGFNHYANAIISWGQLESNDVLLRLGARQTSGGPLLVREGLIIAIETHQGEIFF